MPPDRSGPSSPARWRRSHTGSEVRSLAVAMLLTAGLLAVVEYIYLDHSHERGLRIHAGIVAHSVSAAAIFDSARDATESLQAFRGVADVSEVMLQRPDGSALASYQRDEAQRSWLQRYGGEVQVTVPVLANGTEVARLKVLADRSELWSTLGSLVVALLMVMLGATTFTRLISRRMRAAVRDAEERTRYLAHHDALTGLANRATFSSALELAAKGAREHGLPVTLLCLDVDDFKQINDTYGHATGDDALRTVATLLRELVREDDMVARLGGDEFAVLLTGPRSQETGRRVAREMINRLPAAQRAGTQPAVKVSIGMSQLPADAQTAEEAMQCSDVALYEAKRNGKNAVADYTPALGEGQRERARLQADLRDAIAAQRISLVYQPIFDSGGVLRNVEALARWTHPVRGAIGPAEFIPIAEESGLIVDLGLACMRQARIDIDAWRSKGLSPVPVALNISSQQLHREADRRQFLEQLEASRLQPGEVEFELTESVLFDDLNNPDSILVRLQSMGYALAIDDFGTGYSSLAYLRRIRCRKLKIDRLFVAGIEADHDNALMVEAMLRVAHSLDMLVVAEGVERKAEHDRLMQLGCDLYQGFGLARPQPAHALESWLRAAPAPAAVGEGDQPVCKSPEFGGAVSS
ncbi:MAG TPA: EAL domain-containing protein [Ideonella sp.]|uniref:putative bifunctional diguanylate cyclase/phosphodiesterase n=1 Tax=Ideonella sp. TaxID=1929293 RepID=UPI002E3027B1|nr:EAL domain-containing protein [Ideonella sp.]HEX5688305.1 EAL domain-containing protein [Ideonella sp.]